MGVLGTDVAETQVVDVIGTTPVVEAIYPVTSLVEIPVVVGPAGPSGQPGPPGPVGLVFTQSVPAASWVFAHSIGRRPDVTVYIGDEIVDADIFATASQVSASFPSPVSGSLILV